MQVNRLLLLVNNAVNYRNGKIGLLIFLICGMGGKSDDAVSLTDFGQFHRVRLISPKTLFALNEITSMGGHHSQIRVRIHFF